MKAGDPVEVTWGKLEYAKEQSLSGQVDLIAQ
jgi:hypothetical protein